MALFGTPQPGKKIYDLPIDRIAPSPWQARKTFEQDKLEELAESIRKQGLLQPIHVRKTEDGYQLIAGERRLRACKSLGMEKIPAIITSCEDMTSALLGLEENTVRSDLNCFEEAAGMELLWKLWGCTQNEAARRLGIGQSTLANKLRLLQLSEEMRNRIAENGLTERHARALLSLPEDRQKKVLDMMIAKGWNVTESEQYIARLLNPKRKPKKIFLVRDARIFINTVNKAIATMQASGLDAKATVTQRDSYIEYTVRIPTGAAEKKKQPAAAQAGQ